MAVIVVGTPLGNIGDASDRLREVLGSADVIAAEDTRRTRALAGALGVAIRGRVVSNFDHNEEERLGMLLDAARSGDVAVLTDAGMPVVSDPGFALVAAAHDAGIPVTCVPGPSAVTTALALSGLDVGRFIFDGFAPRKDGARRRWLEALREERRATCFFDSPFRVAATLEAAAEVLGGARRVAVCRELTKLHEEVIRAPLCEIVSRLEAGVRGEVTVVLEGASSHPPASEGERDELLPGLVAEVRRLVAGGERLKAACKAVAKGTSIANGELYDAVVRARRSDRDDRA